MKINFLILLFLAIESASLFLMSQSVLHPAVIFLSLLSLLYIPGFLMLLSLRLDLKNIWMTLLHSLGLSIFLIYILGIFASYALPLWGFSRPLEFSPFAFLHFFVVLLLFAVAVVRNWNVIQSGSEILKNLFKILGVVLCALLSLISIIGAFTLNNGGENIITLTWIAGLVAVYFLISFFQSSKYDFLRPYVIFTLSLSILWALSARSWHLIGWDIVQELSVARNTYKAALWSPGFTNDAYNACLSITILPTVLSRLTTIPIENIFKFLFPLIFSQFPVSVYFLLKKQSNKNIAYLSVLYIIAQPFFIQPMIALARQEIAFFFFPVLLHTMFSEKLKGGKKVLLITVYTFALVVSHYSTSYVALIIFSLAYFFIISFQLLRRLPLPARIKEITGYQNWILYKSNLKGWIVLMFLVFTYTWYFLVTHSAGNVIPAIQDSFKNMSKLFQGDQKSQEVKQAIPGQTNVSFTTYSDLSSYEEYYNGALHNIPAEKLAQISQKYPLSPVKELVVSPIIDKSYASIAHSTLDRLKDLLKYLLIIGTLLLVLKTFKKEDKNLDVTLFAGVCSVLLLVIILHPTLGLKYNISRIYLQLLPFLSFSLIYLLDSILFFLGQRQKSILLALMLSVVFLYFQGILTPIIGGVPVLHLYNFGTDYEKFYIRKEELSSANWLESNRNFKNTVYGDDLSGLRIRQETFLYTNTSIIPVVIANNATSYVYQSVTNTINGKAQVNFNNKFLTYTYPSKFLDENKNLIYSNNKSKIYK